MSKIPRAALETFLDQKVEQYNVPGFIENDPICIPHQFSKKQDIEIMGFWAAVLAWGQRKTIISKCRELIALMDGTPHDFILNHQPSDLKRFLHFKHRTFNATDTLYFIEFLSQHYQQFDSLEHAFTQLLYTAPGEEKQGTSIEFYLNNFRRRFFSLPDFPPRTGKHIPAPERNSACKRLNMFLRWMVRKDEKGVDFGLWQQIKPSELICPLDLHVDRVARKLGLINRKQCDWKTAIELTTQLRQLDANDPAKYDFALFGLGIEENF